MLNFMGCLRSLFLLCPIAYSHVPGTGNSEEVTFLKRSQGDDAVFRLDQKIGNDTQRIMWISAFKQLILVNTSAGESSPDWIINSKQYEGRLSLLPDKSLMLSNLTTEDSGCYEADIKSVSGEITTQKFNLTIIETKSTKPNVNLWITIATVISVLAFVLSYVIYQKRYYKRTCQPWTSHRTRLSRELPVTTIQEDIEGMRNGPASIKNVGSCKTHFHIGHLVEENFN